MARTKTMKIYKIFNMVGYTSLVILTMITSYSIANGDSTIIGKVIYISVIWLVLYAFLYKWRKEDRDV